ncbi:MAG TPA: nitrate reductase molybdenum cofactor assembly chaperone [Candidatus Azoamicus sp.]
MIKIKTYKVFSALLLYPDYDFKYNSNLASNILLEESILNIECINMIISFIEYINKNDLLFLQEEYVSLFDRQKQFSLYLFEHIHGDSRDRGMAMIDLKNLYKASNFDIPLGGELPDYIPVFLEYLSVLSLNKSSILLGEVINIIAILRYRLKLINNIYSNLFFALESLSTVKSDNDVVEKAVVNNSFNFINKDLDDTKIF